MAKKDMDNEEILDENIENTPDDGTEDVADTADENTSDENTSDVEASSGDEETSDDSEERPSEENESEESEGEDEKARKKSLFGKKKDKKDQQIEELNDKLKRQMAEFENFRKRTEKEKSTMYDFGAKDILEKILPTVDNFERALAVECQDSAFKDGMDKIYKNLIKSLEESGVKQIEACGQEFDPNLHNAVMHIDDENYGDNEVVEELQKGYMYKDTVLRHSMVKVAN